MYELEVLPGRQKMEHMTYLDESLLELSAKKELNYREFPYMALQNEWNGRHCQRSMKPQLKLGRLDTAKTCVPAETMECVERVLQ